MEKESLAGAYRKLKSSNKKTRKRALHLIHEIKRKKSKKIKTVLYNFASIIFGADRSFSIRVPIFVLCLELSN